MKEARKGRESTDVGDRSGNIGVRRIFYEIEEGLAGGPRHLEDGDPEVVTQHRALRKALADRPDRSPGLICEEN